jgi:hypothetical protein
VRTARCETVAEAPVAAAVEREVAGELAVAAAAAAAVLDVTAIIVFSGGSTGVDSPTAASAEAAAVAVMSPPAAVARAQGWEWIFSFYQPRPLSFFFLCYSFSLAGIFPHCCLVRAAAVAKPLNPHHPSPPPLFWRLSNKIYNFKVYNYKI